MPMATWGPVQGCPEELEPDCDEMESARRKCTRTPTADAIAPTRHIWCVASGCMIHYFELAGWLQK